MKAYVNPPILVCGACGSILLVQRPRNGYAPVRCLADQCKEKDKPYAYKLPEIELDALPIEQPIA